MNATHRAPPDADWRPVRTSLGFTLATISLWYWRFDAMAYDRHFTDVPVDMALSECPFEASGTFILPSYPVSAPPAPLRIAGEHLIYTPKTFPNYYVDLNLDGGFEAYLQQFSTKTRSTLRRKVRKFAEASPEGKLDWRVYRTDEEMADFLRLATRLSERTYQARLLDCGLPTDTEFRRDALDLSRRGHAYGFLLFLGDRPVAYVYSKRRRGVVTYDFVGHEPELNALSPGTVLQYQLLEYLFADPEARIFDFTEGEGAHKSLFATDKKLCAKSLVFPRQLRTRLLIDAHRTLERINRFVDILADRLKLRQGLRRFVRREAPPARDAGAQKD